MWKRREGSGAETMKVVFRSLHSHLSQETKWGWVFAVIRAYFFVQQYRNKQLKIEQHRQWWITVGMRQSTSECCCRYVYCRLRPYQEAGGRRPGLFLTLQCNNSKLLWIKKRWHGNLFLYQNIPNKQSVFATRNCSVITVSETTQTP